VLLVVSHTAAKAIVQLLLLLPLYERTVIMSMLEAISCHELVAHGRNVRLRHLGRRQSGYAMLLHSFRYFVNATDQDSDTDQDTDTAAETAAAEALSASAEIVLKSMPALRNNVSLIQQLHGAVDTRVETAFRPMGDVNPVNDLHEVSELSSVPSDDVVNHRDNDVVNHRENDVVNHRDNDHDINTV
jgi:hypothetical protein